MNTDNKGIHIKTSVIHINDPRFTSWLAYKQSKWENSSGYLLFQ